MNNIKQNELTVSSHLESRYNLFVLLKLLPGGMTTSAPAAGAVKLFSAEPCQKEALDQRLETQGNIIIILRLTIKS